MTPPDNLSESEAEIALLALGPQLHWWYAGTLLRTDDKRIVGTTDREWYEIRPNADRSQFAAIRAQGQDGSPFPKALLSTEAAAKAACEKHYATGKWQ